MEKNSIDQQNMGKAIYDFPDQLENALEIGLKFKLINHFENIRNIVVAGMGGSAIGGDVCRVLTSNELSVPLSVCRNYSLPNWVNHHTLVICSSYSGNTEESLSSFLDARKKGAKICGISTGGQITNKLKENELDIIMIPSGLQPRAALAYSVVPMLFHLINQGLISESVIDYIRDAIVLLKRNRENYSRESERNPTYSLARNIFNTLPIIYGTNDSTAVAALRLKGQFCENAEMLAYLNELPEMNHNEIVGWENNQDIFNRFSILWLTDKNDYSRIKLRQKLSSDIISGKTNNQFIIQVEGETVISRLLHMIHFGDWVTYWCSLLHGTDPSPVKPIMLLKEKLLESSNKDID